jgi:hypothetical protein
MHRASETIGALAAALAKAQGELTNPEKSLSATIPAPFPGAGQKTFRYASLASGLDIVRKSLGRHQIATIQTTAIDQDSGQIRLTTLLAHGSGEWISSDWPVCPISETATPQRMGAALTYARRYALFALVGIAGEDDLDAPEVFAAPAVTLPDPKLSAPPRPEPPKGASPTRRQPKPVLAAEPSAGLRDQLIAELAELKDGEELARWAHRRLPAKNTLTADDARAVEDAGQSVLSAFAEELLGPEHPAGPVPRLPAKARDADAPSMTAAATAPDQVPEQMVTVRRQPRRRRNKAHLAFVAAQPCLICQRCPCDAHHLKFAQPRSLGSKVSDEFTVPLCRDHHRQLHDHGNEVAWWANVQIDASKVAKELWASTELQAGRAVPSTATPSGSALE